MRDRSMIQPVSNVHYSPPQPYPQHRGFCTGLSFESVKSSEILERFLFRGFWAWRGSVDGSPTFADASTIHKRQHSQSLSRPTDSNSQRLKAAMVSSNLDGGPFQLKFVRPAQMQLFARALCYPHLGQITSIPHGQLAVGSHFGISCTSHYFLFSLSP